MDKILEFLKEAKPCFVATVEDGEPRVRPQGFAMEFDGKLCMCTADEKATSIALKKCPAVEVAACAGTKFIRIRGKAEFLGEDAAAKALEIMPPLAQMVRPGKFEVFAIVNGQAVISDLMTGEAETIEL